jgi:hypothetical protein
MPLIPLLISKRVLLLYGTPLHDEKKQAKAKENFNLAKADVSYKIVAEYELGLIN